MTPEAVAGLFANAGPYALTIGVIVCLVTGVLAPRWIVDDLKSRLEKQDQVIAKTADAFATINDLIRQQRVDALASSAQVLDAFNRLSEFLRDRRP